MDEFLTPNSIANSIMLDDSFDGWILLVEGQNDYILFNRLINKDTIKIIQGHGKDKVKEVLAILKERNFDKIIGIVDSDFDNILGETDNIKNLFKTDDHDLEIMMFKTDAFSKLLDTTCDFDKINNLKREQDIKDIILGLIEDLGKLKLINVKEKLGVKFKPKESNGNILKYEKFIDFKEMIFLGEDLLMKTINEYSDNRTKVFEMEKLKQEYEKIKDNTYNIYDLVNGHDLSNVIFKFIKKTLKSNSNLIKDYTCIEKTLLVGYDITDIFDTKLFSELIQFANLNNIKIIDNKLLDRYKSSILSKTIEKDANTINTFELEYK